MTPAAIIAEVYRRGVTLRLDGPDIIHRGPRGALDPDIIACLKANKPSIVAALRGAAVDTSIMPCPGDVAERIAIIEEGDKCSREDAQDAALATYGLPSWQSLATAHSADIRSALSHLPKERTQDGATLLNVTRQFIASPWFMRAMVHGWSLTELFGITALRQHNDRADGLGLVAWLALFAPSPIQLIALDDAEAGAVRRTGSIVFYRRFVHCMSDAVVWWEHSDVVDNGGVH